MIFLPYFADFSIADKVNRRAIKSIEMIKLSYLYLREFLPKDTHLYYYDNCSPIITDYFFSFIKEPVEILAVDQLNIDKNYKVHLKSNPKFVNFEVGLTRRIADFLKIAYYNNEDYFALDADALIAYNFLEDFEDLDFGGHKIHNSARSMSTFLTYLSNKKLKEKDIFCKLPDFIDHIFSDSFSINSWHLGFKGEGALFKHFCSGKIGELKQQNKCIHDEPKDKLLEFIKNNSINHPFLGEFIDLIQNNNLLK